MMQASVSATQVGDQPRSTTPTRPNQQKKGLGGQYENYQVKSSNQILEQPNQGMVNPHHTGTNFSKQVKQGINNIGGGGT